MTLLAGTGQAMGALMRGGTVDTRKLAAARPRVPMLTVAGRPDPPHAGHQDHRREGIDRTTTDSFTMSVTIVDGRGVSREIDLGPQPADGIAQHPGPSTSPGWPVRMGCSAIRSGSRGSTTPTRSSRPPRR